MVKALFDSSILIDHLNQVEQATAEFSRYDEIAISRITWIEVLVGARDRDEAAAHLLLSTLRLIELDPSVAERAVELRRERRIRLPDAIIWASADVHDLLIVTRNTKDFPADYPRVRIPYML